MRLRTTSLPLPAALAVICGVALSAGMFCTPARASEWDQRTIVTIKNEPLQIRDVVLDPGTYVFKLLNTVSARNWVQIYTADERSLVNTIQGVPAYRPAVTSQMFTYWETPTGDAPALHTWFYPGQLIGQSFPYPDHPRVMTASATVPAQPAPTAAPPPAPSATEQAPAASPEEAPQIAEAAPAPPPPSPAEPQAAPPAPPPAQAAPTQPAQNQPAQMPKTASPFPLIGLFGLLSLSFAGLLRLIRLS